MCDGAPAGPAAFTADWFRKRGGYRGVYHRFAEAILEVFRPESVADVGCGAGWIVEYLTPRLPVIGVDGCPDALRLMAPDVRRHVHLADLTGPVLPQMADHELCVAIEVAEHIPAGSADAFLDWCTQGARLLLTAAPPGQRGLGHVNCRPQEWWIERMAARGWRHDPRLTGAWQAAAIARTRGCPWVVRNAMAFVREPGA